MLYTIIGGSGGSNRDYQTHYSGISAKKSKNAAIDNGYLKTASLDERKQLSQIR